MRPVVVVLAVLAALVAAAPAAASSIVLVRDGDLWLATPDGAFERRLTTGGGYDSPSMADDGTIVALRGGSFVRVRPDGATVGAPVQAVGGDWLVDGGPFDPRVSPDGLRIAYWFSGGRRLCLPTEAGCSLQSSDVSAYSYADRATDPLELGVVRGYREPSWLGSARAVLFRYGTGTGETVAVNRAGGGEGALEGWFSYNDGTQLGQGEVSHAGDRLAAIAKDQEIHLFGVAVSPPALPALRCIVRGRRFSSPTWSPDGSMLAWAEADGVHVAGPVPDLRAPVDCSVIRERRLAGGSDPFWGPADVPGAPAAMPPTTPARPIGKRPRRAFGALRVARRQHGGVVRLRLRILRGPARVAARLTHDGRPAGRARVRRARTGTLRLRVPLRRGARRTLARRGRLPLRLRVAVRAPGGLVGTAHRRVTLRAVKRG